MIRLFLCDQLWFAEATGKQQYQTTPSHWSRMTHASLLVSPIPPVSLWALGSHALRRSKQPTLPELRIQMKGRMVVRLLKTPGKKD